MQYRICGTRGQHPKIITLHWSYCFSFGIALHAALSRVLTRRPWTNLSCPGQTLSFYRYLVALNGRKPVGGDGRQPLSWQIYGITPEKRPRVDGWNRPETPTIVHNRYHSVPFIVPVKYVNVHTYCETSEEIFILSVSMLLQEWHLFIFISLMYLASIWTQAINCKLSMKLLDRQINFVVLLSVLIYYFHALCLFYLA